MNNFIIVVLIVLSNIKKVEPSITLTRGTLDLIDGIVCKGTTLQNIPRFGCMCTFDTGTFYEHDGKYCHSSSQILTVEGKFYQFSFFFVFSQMTLYWLAFTFVRYGSVFTWLWYWFYLEQWAVFWKMTTNNEWHRVLNRWLVLLIKIVAFLCENRNNNIIIFKI